MITPDSTLALGAPHWSPFAFGTGAVIGFIFGAMIVFVVWLYAETKRARRRDVRRARLTFKAARDVRAYMPGVDVLDVPAAMAVSGRIRRGSANA